MSATKAAPEPTWHGALIDRTWAQDGFAGALNDLADAAKSGMWDGVMTQLSSSQLAGTGPNVWRPGGESWYTPLHQAAWHGSPAAVVEHLLGLGAWKALRTADNLTAHDIAARKGHTHLLPLLAPPREPQMLDPALFDHLDHQLHGLVLERVRAFRLDVAVRPLPTRVLLEVGPGASVWFPIPGMYGGFNVELRRGHLYVESWSRVAGGSGQAHLVTGEQFILVEQGFV